MEMSLNRTSLCCRPPVLSPWLLAVLWALLLPDPVTPATDPAAPTNGTLLFDGGGPGDGLRNCSCSAPVRDCDEALANLLCSCRSVPRSSLPSGGLRAQGALTVWVRQPWVLSELLDGSEVSDLRLSYCGPTPLTSRHLALFGLRTLRVHSATPGASHPDQDLTFASRAEWVLPTPDPSSVLHVTILDVAVLNGLSALKAYSVAGPTVPTLSQHFPQLTLPQPPSVPQDPQDTLPSDPQQDCLLTFIY